MIPFTVEPIGSDLAARVVIECHYLHRRPPISFAFGLRWPEGRVAGVVTFGTPASRHLQIGACPDDPALVIELNRLWVADNAPKNTETWFLARALRLMPPRVVVSYADTTREHFGYVYRAANFHYAGWTDMERRLPRRDYVVAGSHSRQAYRDGVQRFTHKVRRRPKARYWTVTGNNRDRKRLTELCRWPMLDWRVQPVPGELTRAPDEPRQSVQPYQPLFSEIKQLNLGLLP